MFTKFTSRTLGTVSLVIAGLWWSPQIGLAQFDVGPSVEYGEALSPSGMTGADFDGDGHIDLATTADGPERVLVMKNAGDGTIASMLSSLLPSGSSPQDLVAGDLDGDEDFDVAVALRDDPDGAVRLMLNNGNGTFTLGPSIPVGDRPRGLSIADMDNDEDLDLAVANRNSDTVSVLTNNGTGTFTAAHVSVGAEPRATAFGDFLGDTALEIVVTNHDDRTVSILSQSGGAWTSVMTLPVGNPIRPDGVVAADLDGVGFDDFAVATSHFGGPGDQADFATVFISNSVGFGGPFHHDTGGTSSSEVIAADLNCDGHLDLVVSNTDSNDLSLLANNGDGSFGEGQRAQTGAGPGKPTAADLDSDGDPDLAVPNSISGDVSVLINHTCVVPGDLDGDGDVDAGDHAVFATCMNGPDALDPPIGCTQEQFDLADLQADFDVDAADFAEFSRLFAP